MINEMDINLLHGEYYKHQVNVKYVKLMCVCVYIHTYRLGNHVFSMYALIIT